MNQYSKHSGPKGKASSAAGAASSALSSMSDAADDLSGRALGAVDRFSAAGRNSVGAMTDWVRDNPMRATLIALGAGYVLGLTRGRGHRAYRR